MKSKHSLIWLQNTTDIKEPNIKKEALKPIKDTLQKILYTFSIISQVRK